MKNFFKKTPKGPTIEERLVLLENMLEQEKQAKLKLEAELLSNKKQDAQKLANANTELAVLRERQKQYDDKRNSKDPWVEVVGESIDPIQGIEIRLDWNPAFVQYLKDNGIDGKDEDVIVQHWLALLYQDLFQKLDQKVIDESDKKTVSDFI
jgi:hypothetical protein